MSANIWTPNAPVIAQVNTITVGGTPANGQIYSVTINGKSVTYTATGTDTNTTIATALQALLAASTFAEFLEVTWANPSAGVITGTMNTTTANTTGVPFINTSSATGTGTLVTTTTTANSGPSDVSLAANWSAGVPVNGQDLYFQGTSIGALYNLQALNGVTVNSINWDSTFTGNAALPVQNPNGYAEYRQRYFQIGATTENFLPGTGGGSGFIARDNGSAAWTVNVNNTGNPAQQGQPALFLKGTNAANVLNVTRGVVGSATLPSEAATWTTINVGYQQSQNTDVTLILGAGCTLTTINQNGGQVSVNSAVTTLTQRGGAAFVYGTATVGTLDVEAGTCNYYSNGTLTTATVGVAGTLDFSKDPRSRTVTNCTVYGTLIDPDHTVSFSTAVYFPNGIGNNGASLNYGTNFRLTRS